MGKLFLIWAKRRAGQEQKRSRKSCACVVNACIYIYTVSPRISPQGLISQKILQYRLGAYSVATKSGYKYLLFSGRYLSPSNLC